MRLIVLGPPGAGKGTQSKLLAESLGLPHVASGDLFRDHELKGTPLGLKSMEYLDQGLLVPDEVAMAMVLERILPPMCWDGFLLDGFPRNLAQAEALDESLAARGQQVDRTMLIRIPQDEIAKRLSGRLVCRGCQTAYHEESAPPQTPGTCDLCGAELYQRPDDIAEAVKVRMRVYQDETEALLDYYRQTAKLVEVHGVGTVEDVHQRVLGAMKD